MHPKLIELGLIHYVEALRREGYARLFPELRVDAAGKVSGRASEWFTDYRREVGVGSDDGRSPKVFHSFRHTMIYQLHRAKVNPVVNEQLAGHKSKSINVNVYGGELDLILLAEAITKLTYPVQLPAYRATPEHALARRRACRPVRVVPAAG